MLFDPLATFCKLCFWWIIGKKYFYHFVTHRAAHRLPSCFRSRFSVGDGFADCPSRLSGSDLRTAAWQSPSICPPGSWWSSSVALSRENTAESPSSRECPKKKKVDKKFSVREATFPADLTLKRPRLGFCFPAKIFSAVDLPIPFVPTRPRTSPGRGIGRLKEDTRKLRKI